MRRLDFIFVFMRFPLSQFFISPLSDAASAAQRALLVAEMGESPVSKVFSLYDSNPAPRSVVAPVKVAGPCGLLRDVQA